MALRRAGRWPAADDRTGEEMAVTSLQKQPARAEGDSLRGRGSNTAGHRLLRLLGSAIRGKFPSSDGCTNRSGAKTMPIHTETSNITARQAFRCSPAFIGR